MCRGLIITVPLAHQSAYPFPAHCLWSVWFIWLIWFVLFIWLIWFIWLLSFNQKPDKLNRPDKPNNGLPLPADLFSILLETRRAGEA
jgi:hypothetical protein